MMRTVCATVTPRAAYAHAAGSARQLRTMAGNPQGRLVGRGMDGMGSGRWFAALPQSCAAIGEHVVGTKQVASASCRAFGTCISRESIPGHIDGNDVFYH